LYAVQSFKQQTPHLLSMAHPPASAAFVFPRRGSGGAVSRKRVHRAYAKAYHIFARRASPSIRVRSASLKMTLRVSGEAKRRIKKNQPLKTSMRGLARARFA